MDRLLSASFFFSATNWSTRCINESQLYRLRFKREDTGGREKLLHGRCIKGWICIMFFPPENRGAFMMHVKKHNVPFLFLETRRSATVLNVDTMSMDYVLLSPKLMHWFNHSLYIKLDLEHQTVKSLQSIFWPVGVAKLVAKRVEMTDWSPEF